MPAAPPTISFKPGNLTALRELALRRTADRVDDQMVTYLRQNAIEGPWPTAERILVCVGPDPQFASGGAGRQPSGERAQCLLGRRPSRTDRPRDRAMPRR